MANKLDVWKVTKGAFLIPWRDRSTFSIALVNPILLMATINLIWFYTKEHVPSWLDLGLFLAYLMLFTILATTCHRLVLLKISNINSLTAMRWSWRETWFLFWLIAVALILAGFTAILATALFLLVSFVHRPEYLFQVILYSVILTAVILFVTYLSARLSLIFPTVAVDKEINIKTVWKLTQNNGWRLTFIDGVLPWLLSYLVNFVYRENASLAETVFLTVFGFILVVVEITAISLSYYELTRTDNTKLES